MKRLKMSHNALSLQLELKSGQCVWGGENLMMWLFFFLSSSTQTGQGAEGEAVRLPGCHLWSVCHWSHQQNSSPDVSVSLVALHSPHYVLFTAHWWCTGLFQWAATSVGQWTSKNDCVKSTTCVFTAVLKSLRICSAALIIRSEFDFHASSGTRDAFFTCHMGKHEGDKSVQGSLQQKTSTWKAWWNRTAALHLKKQ